MARTLTVVFDGEVFRPTEPVDLPANSEYEIVIADDSTTPLEDEYPLVRFLDLTIESGRGDFAEQHDHYLYGAPKR
jgi:hypothetical protein